MPTKPEPPTVPGPRAASEPGAPEPTVSEPGASGDDVLVDVSDLYVRYALRRGPLSRLGGGGEVIKAVDGVSFGLRRGEVLGLVGESGSGKSTLGRALLGLVPASSGSIRYAGTELVGLPERRLRPLRRKLQMVFQDPHASLNPAMDVETAVGHPLRIHGLAGPDLRDRVARALEMVGLTPAGRYLSMRPADLSGGQKQRVVIARATILNPQLLVADEPVSMLDMSVRAKILQLLLDLRHQLNLTYLYITHDLATAKLFCDRIAIMYLGRIVEIGSAEEVFARPRHPYTQALLRAIPDLEPDRDDGRDVIRGEIPDAARPPAGCSYHPRCPHAFAPCGFEGRDLRALLEARWTGLGEEAAAGESKRFADLADLDGHDERGHDARGERDTGGRVRIRPARGHGVEELIRVLDDARRDAPDAPFWRGVRAVEPAGGDVVVRFEPAIDPALRDPGTPGPDADADSDAGGAGTARVACHLYDHRQVRVLDGAE